MEIVRYIKVHAKCMMEVMGATIGGGDNRMSKDGEEHFNLL